MIGHYTAEPCGIDEFATAAGEFLRRDRVRNTVFLTHLNDHAPNTTSSQIEPSTYIVVRNADGAVAGAAMQSAFRAAFLSDLPPRAAATVSACLAEHAPWTQTVEGREHDASAIAHELATRLSRQARLQQKSRLYALNQLKPPETAGIHRTATTFDETLCRQWLTEFGWDVNPGQPAPALAAVRDRINAGAYSFWENGERAVALAGRKPAAHGVCRIGPVYTSAHYRNRGYGRAVTAAVAADIQAEGLQPCLYADLANPASNNAYIAVGFEPVADFAKYQIS
jgi:predicted GNAT family acetyltransferase